jgi:ornithine cyclodeaminase
MAEHGRLWISEREAAELLSLPEAIDVLATAYRGAAASGAVSMPRAHVPYGDRILHAVGGVLSPLAIAGVNGNAGENGIAGTKTWLYTPAGARPLLILFALEDGAVLAVIEAFALGQRRTAATSGLGTSLLANPDADVLALLGTGKQALSQAQAVAAVRPIRRVQVFGRDARRREAFCGRLADELGAGIEVDCTDQVAAALHGAGIVTTITRAAEPIVSVGMLAPGMHINAVGAIVPNRSELEPGAVGRCDMVVADSRVQAREDSAELRSAVAAGTLRFEDVVELAELVADPSRGRTNSEQITLLKALGVGLSDIALGVEVLTRASEMGLGSPLPGAPEPDVQESTRRKTHV